MSPIGRPFAMIATICVEEPPVGVFLREPLDIVSHELPVEDGAALDPKVALRLRRVQELVTPDVNAAHHIWLPLRHRDLRRITTLHYNHLNLRMRQMVNDIKPATNEQIEAWEHWSTVLEDEDSKDPASFDFKILALIARIRQLEKHLECAQYTKSDGYDDLRYWTDGFG